MKGKIFEWVDQGLQVPLALLHSPDAAIEIQRGLGFADEVQGDLRFAWARHFEAGRSGRYRTQRMRMLDQYWALLASEFAGYVLRCAGATRADDPDQAFASASAAWARTVCLVAQQAFEQAAAQLGDDAVSLRQRVQAEAHCRALLIKSRKEFA
jgi:hypothetical protein